MAGIAVVGTWRSGSSATAEMLRSLGVTMGESFIDYACEDKWLAEQLQEWFCEPRLFRTVPEHVICDGLKTYMRKHRDSAKHFGAKHPILSMCAAEIENAWGDDIKFIWTHRVLRESIASLRRTRWWPKYETEMQAKVYQRAEEIYCTRDALKLDWQDTLADARATVDRIATYLCIAPTPEQIRAAVEIIRCE